MKKKILSVILCSLSIMSLVACGTQTPPAISDTPSSTGSSVTSVDTGSSVDESSTKETTTSADRPDEDFTYEECELIYRGILEDCYNVVFHKMQPTYSELYPLFADTNYYDDEQKARVGYLFTDIDGNGRSELLICTDDQIHALCTYNEDGAYILQCAGYRSSMSIYETGNVRIEGSSGAACYSYDYFTWEDGELRLSDFYYTDSLAPDYDVIHYYHNPDGVWDDDPSTEITMDEFNIANDVGVEELKFGKKLTQLNIYADVWGNGSDGIELSDLYDTSWDLEYTQCQDMMYDTSDLTLQYIEIKEDGTVVYCHNDEGHDFFTTDIEVNIDDWFRQISLNLEDELGRNITLNIVRIDNLGHLVVQRIYYDPNIENSVITNEYYKITMG